MTFTFVTGGDGRTPARPRGWLAALVIFIVAQWMVQSGWAVGQLIRSWFAFLGQPSALAHDMQYLATSFFVIEAAIYGVLAIVAIAFSVRVDRRGLKELGLTGRAAFEALPWIVVGLLAAAPVLMDFLIEPRAWSQAPQGLAILAPAVLVQAGAEEIIFRGILLASLAARYGPGKGLLVSAALFAFWHLTVGQTAADALFRAATTFVFGLTSGLLVLRQGHLGGAIALHVVWNVCIYLTGGLDAFPESSFWQGVLNSLFDAPIAPWDDPEVRQTVVSLVIETTFVALFARLTFQKLIGEAD